MLIHADFVRILDERLRNIKAVPVQLSYQHPDFMSVQAWSRKKFTNYSGIVLIELGGPIELMKTVVKMSGPMGKEIGYTPFFAPIGLSMIFTCEGWMPSESEMKDCLDKINTMEVIRQHLTFVDLKSGKVQQVRAWGTFMAAKIPNLIREAADDFAADL